MRALFDPPDGVAHLLGFPLLLFGKHHVFNGVTVKKRLTDHFHVQRPHRYPFGIAHVITDVDLFTVEQIKLLGVIFAPGELEPAVFDRAFLGGHEQFVPNR